MVGGLLNQKNMAVKIYSKNTDITVERDGLITKYPKTRISIEKRGTLYFVIDNVRKGESFAVEFDDIQQENGSTYADQATFDAWIDDSISFKLAVGGSSSFSGTDTDKTVTDDRATPNSIIIIIPVSITVINEVIIMKQKLLGSFVATRLKIDLLGALTADLEFDYIIL